MIEFNKYTFGTAAICSLSLIQVGAWILGFDGQVTIFCTGAITAVLGYVIGKKV